MITWLFPKTQMSQKNSEIVNICYLLSYFEKVLPRWLIATLVLFFYTKVRLFGESPEKVLYIPLDLNIAYVLFFMFSFLIIINVITTKVILKNEDSRVLEHYKKHHTK